MITTRRFDHSQLYGLVNDGFGVGYMVDLVGYLVGYLAGYLVGYSVGFPMNNGYHV